MSNNAGGAMSDTAPVSTPISGANKKRKVSEGGAAIDINSAGDVIKACMPVLKFIAGKAEAEPFLEPVDWDDLGIPDYPEVIATPMDLGTVKKRLEESYYANETQFADDVRLVWNNAKTYNQPGSGIYVTADSLSKMFERRMSKVKKSEPSPTAAAGATAATVAGGAPKSKKKAPSTGVATKPVTQSDKVKFSTLIHSLTAPQIGKVVDMITKACPLALNEEDEDDLEIEVDKIDRTTLHALNAYCESCTGNSDVKKKKK